MQQYDTLLQEVINEAREQEDIQGILLTGSVARGDALPGSDLDIRFLLTPGKSRPFQSAMQRDIMVECSYADIMKAQSELETNPMEVYAYLDGRILFDPTSMLAQLSNQAHKRFEMYQTPEQERRSIAYWLHSVRLKTLAALRANDQLKAAFITSTSSWPILTGLWAVNDKPMPPNGSVWFHLKDLSKQPPNMTEQLKRFFCGETQERSQTAIALIDWLLPHLGI